MQRFKKEIMKSHSQNTRDGSAGKVCAVKPHGLSSVPRTHMVKTELPFINSPLSCTHTKVAKNHLQIGL